MAYLCDFPALFWQQFSLEWNPSTTYEKQMCTVMHWGNTHVPYVEIHVLLWTRSSDFIPCEQVILFAWSISTEYFFNTMHLCVIFHYIYLCQKQNVFSMCGSIHRKSDGFCNKRSTVTGDRIVMAAETTFQASTLLGWYLCLIFLVCISCHLFRTLTCSILYVTCKNWLLRERESERVRERERVR
jgi:hypothetical protein